MRLHRLSVTGFGPFGTPQEIDFDALSSAGLFLLHGPTGAGKTSVLDAVCYALYGAVPGARQTPGTSLRSDHTPVGTPTEVVLELTVGERRLEITRRPAQPRKKKKGTGFTTEKAQSWLREYDAPSAAWKPLSRSHQEIGEEITQLMGMSREQFCQVVLLPQGDFARFLRADAEARGKLLGRLFDTRRFAAVEERLAELRRAAEQRVKDGDERLLGLAHRMAQAAGPGAAAGVEERPGEPGLADAVLRWAALARSDAREALDIAGSALAAAEDRQAAARHALDAERELAALQQRHADARRRADELERRRAERDGWQARLDRSRKAERVAPALALRDEAVRAHETAGAAHARIRAALPPDLADAGAEQLSARESRLRQDLGALDLARRDERRHAEIAAERADLERQAQADEETIQEAAGWLAHWDTTRGALQQRIADAQEAATLAEHLAGRLEPARRRLSAARRRDALAADVRAAESDLTAARERALDAHETWLDLKSRRLRGIAAELAAGLVSGESCAVCGSQDHPAPARPDADHVDKATEDAAYESHTRASAARSTAEATLAAAREALGAARAEVTAGLEDADGVPRGVPASAGAAAGTGGALDATRTRPADDEPTVGALAEAVSQLEAAHGVARAAAGVRHEAEQELARAEREYEERTEARQRAELRVSARTSRWETLDQEQASLEQGLAKARGEAASVAERAALLEEEIARLDGAAEAVRAVEATALRLKEADDRLADAAFRAGFDTPADAAAALLDDAGHRDLQHRLDAFQAEAAAVADRLAEPETRAAAERPPAAPDTAQAVLAEAERAVRDADAALSSVRERCAALTRLSRQAEDEVRTLGPLREEYDRVARLAALTAGTSAENERRMRLESYVLAARLEQVAAAATARLRRMSAGRYTLVHSDARTGGKRAGLGLHVVDAWTGVERDTATLSGGETFFASLALALGLADVVTDEAGGVRLDTLFIDEGFGSLDDQTLDEVLDVLDSLRERDRSVGIVSHVPDLRRRIPAQLEVVKERHGSTVRLRSSPVGG
ncbi:AAA family ATPase [Streptomyces purpureus]|uniref:AAA family ATPase n=1 Tax=Streptomyces purpureus TaxID=1951 RepID=UPI0003805C98|nr:SMC family ATPase [Streptomyces purpureus]